MGWTGGIDSPDGTLHLVACGERGWDNCYTVSAVLEGCRSRWPLLTLIEGGARGADQCAAQWAAGQRIRGVNWVHVPARWSDYPSPTRWRAGHDRNRAMAAMLVDARGKDHGVGVLAFKKTLDPKLFERLPHLAHGGTEHMIRTCWALDLPVWLCRGVEAPERVMPSEPPLTLPLEG